MVKFEKGSRYGCIGLYGNFIGFKVLRRSAKNAVIMYDEGKIEILEIKVFCEVEHIESWRYHGSIGYYNAEYHKI